MQINKTKNVNDGSGSYHTLSSSARHVPFVRFVQEENKRNA